LVVGQRGGRILPSGKTGRILETKLQVAHHASFLLIYRIAKAVMVNAKKASSMMVGKKMADRIFGIRFFTNLRFRKQYTNSKEHARFPG
jgi:hypothetical protein